MQQFIVRGILIGGACGVFGALAGFSDSAGRALGVGMIGGALAGYTMAKIRARRQNRSDK